jgi:histidyl-tRNA synthetase
MRDFLPADKARRERLLGVIRSTYRAHGFDEIETPVMEDSSRLHDRRPRPRRPRPAL